MPFAQVNGTRIRYRIDATAGNDALWLVLSNSLGTDVSMWASNVEAFAKQYRVVRYDTRGRRVRRAAGPVHRRSTDRRCDWADGSSGHCARIIAGCRWAG